MMRALIIGVSLAFAARTATAQTRQTPKTATVAVAKTTAARPQSNAGGTSAVEHQGSKLAAPEPDTATPPPTIMRETFGYSSEGRRDPFVSLFTSSELRPVMSDLR